jgi:hypothetical protein
VAGVDINSCLSLPHFLSLPYKRMAALVKQVGTQSVHWLLHLYNSMSEAEKRLQYQIEKVNDMKILRLALMRKSSLIR